MKKYWAVTVCFFLGSAGMIITGVISDIGGHSGLALSLAIISGCLLSASFVGIMMLVSDITL